MESLDLGATWGISLPTYVDSKTQLTPKSNNVNKQMLTRSASAYCRRFITRSTALM